MIWGMSFLPTTVTIDVLAPSTEQTVTNTVSVVANEIDNLPLNNQATEDTDIVGVSSITGISWIDINSNGIVDTAEIGLPGVVMQLVGTDDFGAAVHLTTTTDALGTYTFADVIAGNYEVSQLQPTLFVDSADFVGSGGGINSGPNNIRLQLRPGVDETGYNFSEVGPTPSLLGKRILLNSRLQSSPLGTLSYATFVSLLAPIGPADLNNDNLIDNLDYGILQSSFGGIF